MKTEDWFIKFAELKKGDWVNFDGLRLQVDCIMTYGGCVCSGHGSEVFPARSRVWDTAIIEGKDTVWMDKTDYRIDEDNDPADDWKK